MPYLIMESNHIQFSFQLFISVFIFLPGRPKKRNFCLRVAACAVCYLLFSWMWERGITSLAESSLFPYVILYFGYAILMAGMIWICFDIHLMEILFIVTGGYATEHMGFSLFRILFYLFRIPYIVEGDLTHLLLTRYLIYAVFAVVMYYAVVRKNQAAPRFNRRDARIIWLSSILLLTAIVLSVYWSYPEMYEETQAGGIICPLYSFLCSAFVLMMEYYVLRENELKRENEAMERRIETAIVQQKSAKEAIDIINIKCHDLKHQLSALAKIDDPEARSEYLREVREAISIYDAVYHTENQVLDYILREKSLIFNEYKVQFSCMAEGKLLSFLSSADVYALMGNALDNALERVLQEAETERVISLQIKGHGEMVLIHMENRCSREPQFHDGLPVTDKADKQNHGFGVRSIRYITEKYHGDMYMRVKNEMFFLDIIFPKPEGSA